LCYLDFFYSFNSQMKQRKNNEKSMKKLDTGKTICEIIMLVSKNSIELGKS